MVGPVAAEEEEKKTQEGRKSEEAILLQPVLKTVAPGQSPINRLLYDADCKSQCNRMTPDELFLAIQRTNYYAPPFRIQ